MIIFKKTAPETKPAVPETENRFEKIRKSAADKHKASDTDGGKRRDRQATEDDETV